MGSPNHTAPDDSKDPRKPFASSPSVRRKMQNQRRRNTDIEKSLRSELYRRGLRYRLHIRPTASLRRQADLVFIRARVAVFIDGCFWHLCSEHGHIPTTNAWYWAPKLQRNVDRDMATNMALREAGWTVLRLWEHELDSEEGILRAAGLIEQAVRPASG